MAAFGLQVPRHGVPGLGNHSRAPLPPAGFRAAQARQEERARLTAIRIAVLADDPRIREKLASLVNQLPELQVVGSAACVLEAAALASPVPPEVVVVHPVAMRDAQGCVQRAAEALPEARIVILNAPQLPVELIGCIRAGAAGFVATAATVDEFAEAIRAVASGKNVLPDSVVPLLFAHLRTEALTTAPREERNLLAALTARQRAVAHLIVEGRSNKEIAARLGVSIHTVKTHLHNALARLSLGSRLQLAAHARWADADAWRPEEVRCS